MNKEEFRKGWDNFCRCINFAKSAMDADAIRFMNEFNVNLNSVIDEENGQR